MDENTTCSVCGFEAIHYLVFDSGDIVCDECVSDMDSVVRFPCSKRRKQLKKFRDNQCELDF